MAWLSGFDYRSPYFYMVTLHAKQGVEPFSILSEARKTGLQSTPLMRRMKGVIYGIETHFKDQVSLTCFTIMPNHIHLIIRILNVEERPSLFVVIEWLIEMLAYGYYEVLGLPQGPSIFEKRWHDWIVKKANTLKTFRDYVNNNPHRALYRLKHSHACFPRTFQTEHYTWTCLGTLSLKETPVRAPIICSRSIAPESELWEKWKAFAQRLGPGSLAIGTFMSPCEKMVRAEVLKNGGGIVHLIPHGISSKGHASAEDEPLLVAGRLSIMTPFPYDTCKPTKKELHDRCHDILNVIATSFQSGVDDLPASR